jgi:hypothetical protein
LTAGSKRTPTSTPYGLNNGHSVASGRHSGEDAGATYGRIVYTQDALVGKSLAELKEICHGRGLPVSGKKQILADRILKSQLSKFPNGAVVQQDAAA